jgi:hypothetical protein
MKADNPTMTRKVNIQRTGDFCDFSKFVSLGAIFIEAPPAASCGECARYRGSK